MPMCQCCGFCGMTLMAFALSSQAATLALPEAWAPFERTHYHPIAA